MMHLIMLAVAAFSAGGLAAVPAAPVSTMAPLTQVHWLITPTGQDIADVYPPEAVTNGKGGAVLLECKVAANGALEKCRVEIEDPVGLEFGQAAMELAPLFMMDLVAPDGSPVIGRTVRIPVMFQIVLRGD